MAQIKSRSEIGAALEAGILQPVMAHRFKFTIGDCDILLVQTTSITVDMKERLIEHTVEQPAGLAVEMLREIESISGRFNVPFKLEFLDGVGGKAVSGITGYAKVLSHEFNLDYSKNEPAFHTLIYKYEPSAI